METTHDQGRRAAGAPAARQRRGELRAAAHHGAHPHAHRLGRRGDLPDDPVAGHAPRRRGRGARKRGGSWRASSASACASPCGAWCRRCSSARAAHLHPERGADGRLTTISDGITGFFAFLPNLFSAMIILVLGNALGSSSGTRRRTTRATGPRVRAFRSAARCRASRCSWSRSWRSASQGGHAHPQHPHDRDLLRLALAFGCRSASARVTRRAT